MVGSSFLDGRDNGISSDGSFDNLLSLFDFPMESLEGGSLYGEDWDPKLQCLGPIPWDDLQGGLPSVSNGKIGNGSLDVLPTTSFPLSDRISHPKQPPSFVDETLGDNVTLRNNSSDGLRPVMFQAPSPVSVLENRNSCSVQKSMLISSEAVIPVRPRSKRLKKKKLSQLSGATEVKEIPSPSWLSGTMAMKENWLPLHVGMKKCTHCEITKTPQWREGPMGPKTLCNACGVRYRSGRLFPEYRPAASPTFVPSLHSNSHKKVIEMRDRASNEAAMAEMEPGMAPLAEFVADE